VSVPDADGIIRHSTRPNIVGQSRRKEFAAMRPLAAATISRSLVRRCARPSIRVWSSSPSRGA
jgi:hypothetical protein